MMKYIKMIKVKFISVLVLLYCRLLFYFIDTERLKGKS